MSAKTRWRGHDILFDGDEWVYVDTGHEVTSNPNRICSHCSMSNRLDDFDPCIGFLTGVSNACCGHGIAINAYVQLECGTVLRDNDAVLFIDSNISKKTP